MPTYPSWAAEREAFLKTAPPRQIPPRILNAVAPPQEHRYGLLMVVIFFVIGVCLCWFSLSAHLWILIIFPLFAIGAFVGNTRLYRRKRFLLQHGIVTTAEVLYIREHLTHVRRTSLPRPPVYQVSLLISGTLDSLTAYIEDPGQVDQLTEKLKNHEAVTLLHAPGNPHHFLLPEFWPVAAVFNRHAIHP